MDNRDWDTWIWWGNSIRIDHERKFIDMDLVGNTLRVMGIRGEIIDMEFIVMHCIQGKKAPDFGQCTSRYSMGQRVPRIHCMAQNPQAHQ